jgi:hypothetical protein
MSGAYRSPYLLAEIVHDDSANRSEIRRPERS